MRLMTLKLDASKSTRALRLLLIVESHYVMLNKDSGMQGFSQHCGSAALFQNIAALHVTLCKLRQK